MYNVDRVINSLEKNNMNGYYVTSIDEAINKIVELVEENSVVSLGGSMTIMRTGIIEHIMSGRYNVLDRYAEGLTSEEITELQRKGFLADVLFTGTNAITENGELYNIDGIGNRVAAMIFGPKLVIVLAGTNKIVKDIEEAKVRMKHVAAPLNAKRLNRRTPCTVTNVCGNCNSPDRICSNEVIMGQQMIRDRVKVIIIDGEYGF
ncbi:MAG: lactate utilization protein [Filifactoraceae bacterium]